MMTLIEAAGCFLEFVISKLEIFSKLEIQYSVLV